MLWKLVALSLLIVFQVSCCSNRTLESQSRLTSSCVAEDDTWVLELISSLEFALSLLCCVQKNLKRSPSKRLWAEFELRLIVRDIKEGFLNLRLAKG